MSIVYQSRAMTELTRLVEKVANSNASVMVVGPSGVGKEVVVDLLHEKSLRVSAPLIKINCAALPRELIESELFGSTKGAFTGATRNRDGLFREAGGGTLFLDEITEMPIDTQAKLLRVLQDRKIRPIGTADTFSFSCRVVSATNRKPQQAIQEGKLREDLFYRLNTIELEIPTLDERPEDIPVLAELFTNQISDSEGKKVKLTDITIAYLLTKKWPGNVRQLQNEVHRAILVCDGPDILPEHFSLHKDNQIEPCGLSVLQAAEKEQIHRVLLATKWNKVQSAKELKIGRDTLYRKIKRYGL
jgi:transcriptional regulator with PAS, ATPase and Fis domain